LWEEFIYDDENLIKGFALFLRNSTSYMLDFGAESLLQVHPK
jgi:hypothetical protein